MFAADKLSANIQTHLQNCVKNQKFKSTFKALGISKPVMLHVFGQYDGRINRGYQLKLHFNNNRTKFNTQAESSLDSAPGWFTDQILSSPDNIVSWELKIKEVLFRFSFTNYKWSLPAGNLIFTHTFKTKLAQDKKSQWVPIL